MNPVETIISSLSILPPMLVPGYQREAEMRYFPIFVDLRERPCLLVGGGEVALRKARLLLGAGARLSVCAPWLHREFADLDYPGQITHLRTEFEPGMLTGHSLVVAATDDPAINACVSKSAQTAGILVNVVDDPVQCSFITPAIVDRSPVIVAISSGGTAPVLARRIRGWLESRLPRRLGELARLAGELRTQAKFRLGSLRARRRLWEHLLEGEFARLVLAGGDKKGAIEQFHRELDAAAAAGLSKQGRVSIVGAGPGDPALLTIRALQLLNEADVILHDRLVSPEILDLARRDAERVPVGKAPGGPATSQQEIHRQMIELASAGQHVVRLKGGDPFVFGRGGEEVLALREAGIAHEIIPGITAALGCAAATALPLTHRGSARALTLLTAHDDATVDAIDWRGLSRPGQTLVFYMGLGRAGRIQARLLQHGKSASTPVAIIQDGTTPGQKTVTGELGELSTLIESHHIGAPALIVVGETAALATGKASAGDKQTATDNDIWSQLALAG
ncbi:MAG: siroheme synthase CysG [Gammaproteobacteria bacterium]